MDYITLGDFMKQPTKVQEELMNYLFGDKKLYPIEITETELRKYIEKETDGKFSLLFNPKEKSYTFEFTNRKYDKRSIQTDDLLQAYWQIVCWLANR